jgi:predicted Zn-dependent protease
MPAPLSPQRARASFHQFYAHYIVLFTLASLMAGALPLRAEGNAGESSTSVARSPQEYSRLLQMDVAPEIAPAPQAHARAKHKAKVPERYDVSKIGARHVDNGVNFYSLDKEVAMGREMAKEWESQSQILTDADVNAYVNSLAQRLVRHSDAKVPFTVKVVDSDEVNAFALPGGFFYVNTGLILAAQNEAELAGVMAHEIAHVAARHATRGLTKSQLWNAVSIPMIFVGGPIGLAVRQVSSFAFPMSTLKFGRDAEREADLLGLEYAYASGYDPVAFVNFFERLQVNHKKPNFMAKAFATHPMNEDRIKRAQSEINTMLPPHEEYVVDTSEFSAVQARLMELEGTRGNAGDGPILHRHTGDRNSSDAGGTDDGRPKLNRR